MAKLSPLRTSATRARRQYAQNAFTIRSGQLRHNGLRKVCEFRLRMIQITRSVKYEQVSACFG